MTTQKFNYDFVSKGIAQLVIALSVQIKTVFYSNDNKFGRVSANNVILIGEALITAKALLPLGYFLPWIAEEMPFSEDTAENYIRAAKTFKDCQYLDQFSPTALYILSKPSVPDIIRVKSIELAKQGQNITKTTVNAIIAGQEISRHRGYSGIQKRQARRLNSHHKKQIKSEDQVKQEILHLLIEQGITPKDEIVCEVGIADIVTDDEIYEIKRHLTRSLLFKAIGQILTYRQAINPSLKPIIVGCEAVEDTIDDVIKYAKQIGVDVIIWT